MRFNPYILSSVAAVAIGCVVSAAAYYYKSLSTEINEVMVFCKLQFNAYNCFDKLISYVEAAKNNVKVCMPSIQNPAIQCRLIKLLREKNIKVRIIIDRHGYRHSTDFFLKELIEAGAEIKCKINGSYNMQHKFCVIDDKVLMTGTLNWGDDLSSDHWNYVYITSKPQLVQPINVEFDQMWNTYTDLEEAIEILSNIDEQNTEIESEHISDEAETLSLKSLDIPILKETQMTPELCIM